MKIAILGTRGIPNNHGGFEQFAECFSVYMAEKGHSVFVYNSHNHPYKKSTFKGVNIIHCFDPEYKIGTAGQFFYDLNCIRDSRKRKFDAILQLGYTSSSIWHRMLPKDSLIVTNMDGLEWKRSKYSTATRKFLRYAENLAIKSSDVLISDSIGIKDYIRETYLKESTYIPYGATIFSSPDKSVLVNYNVTEGNYDMIIARLEPENNIETIVEGFSKSKVQTPILIFGGLNDFGKKLQKKFAHDKRIRFVGPNYNQEDLNNLRYYSRYYFHGHSVGGTNPSLLEAMASSSLIIAHNNIFNRSILLEDAFYFKASADITSLLEDNTCNQHRDKFIAKNAEKIEKRFSWESVNASYEKLILTNIK
ncbi:DUF1972 domain-containing protein [Winogradskyella maritima]|uniref:DUF1972 domain-containing protein n=1 Tax=Winogradskyella maritima TaxID=1517766 RepID=A0ABV8AFG4_9FLAO|nr:DUF1972 domain-containing protein [Winogradskyella maritima]